MSTCLRLNCAARTEQRHTDPTHVQASAIASQKPNTALKKEEVCISINRKAEDLPKLTQQDFQGLAEHAARILRAKRLGLLDGSDVNPATLACLDNIEASCVREGRGALWPVAITAIPFTGLIDASCKFTV